MCERMRWAPLVSVGDRWGPGPTAAATIPRVVHVCSVAGAVLIGTVGVPRYQPATAGG